MSEESRLTGLAARCGRSAPHLHLVLTGQRKPGPELLRRLAEVFGPSWAFVTGQAAELQDPELRPLERSAA